MLLYLHLCILFTFTNTFAVKKTANTWPGWSFCIKFYYIILWFILKPLNCSTGNYKHNKQLLPYGIVNRTLNSGLQYHITLNTSTRLYERHNKPQADNIFYLIPPTTWIKKTQLWLKKKKTFEKKGISIFSIDCRLPLLFSEHTAFFPFLKTVQRNNHTLQVLKKELNISLPGLAVFQQQFFHLTKKLISNILLPYQCFIQ